MDQRKWHVNIQSENCRPLQLVLSSTNSLLGGHSMTTWNQFWTLFDHLPKYLYEDIFTPNVDKIRHFWTTYPPFLVHVVIERPLEPCCRPDEKWSSVKASGGHAAFFSSGLLIYCTVWTRQLFWQKKTYLTCMSPWTYLGKLPYFGTIFSKVSNFTWQIRICILDIINLNVTCD